MTMHFAIRKRTLLSVALGLTAATAMVGASLSSSNAPSSSHARLTSAMEAPSTGELRLALTRVGLTAESLAAAGFTAQQATGLVADAREWMGESVQLLRDADRALSDAAMTRDRLQQLVRSGQATEQDLAAFAAARSALAAADARRQSLLDEFFASATAGNSDRRTMLATINANREWHLPVKYLVSERTVQDWVQLRSAIHNQRACARTDEMPDEVLAQLLRSVDSSGPVTTAAVNLQTYLAGVTSAWNQATMME